MTSNDVDFLMLQPIGPEALLVQSPPEFADGAVPPLAGNMPVNVAGVFAALPLVTMPLLWQGFAGPRVNIGARGGWTASTTADVTQTTSPTIDLAPVGGVQVADGDLILIAATVDHPSTNISTAAFTVDQATATGWTRIGPIADTGSPNDHKAVWFYTKWHNGDPTAFTVTCTFAVEWALSAAAWYGTSDVTPIGSFGYAWETGTTTPTHTTKALTTAAFGSWIGVSNHDRGGGAWTPPAGYTERADIRVTGGTGVSPSVEIADSGAAVVKGQATTLTSTSTTSSSTAVNLIFEIVPFGSTSNPPPQVVYGPWVGAMTSSSFTAVYGFSGLATTARLQVSTDPTLTVSPIFGSAVADDSYGMTTLSVSGLAADTTYYYGVEADGTLNLVGQGSVRTDPTVGSQTSFSVAFGSCQYDAVTSPSFEQIRQRVGAAGQLARRLIHMGDFNYQDWNASDTFNDIINFWSFQVNQPAIAPCLANVPTTYCWDNHDWGGSNSDKTSVRAADVAAAMRKMVPHYTLSASDGVGGWYSYVIGRVRFIQFDPRSQRDNYLATNGPTKTMLGTEQKAWFKGQLDQTEPIKIIQANMLWRQGALDNDRWGSFPDEFTELNTYISANASGNIGHVYVVTGDRHAIAADDGSALTPGESSYGVPQAVAIFQQGSETSHESWSQGHYGPEPTTIVGYGWLDITDNGTSFTIAFDGRTSDDLVTRISMTTNFSLGTNATASVSTIAPTKVAISAGTAQAGAVPVVSTIAPPVVTVTAAGSAQAGAVPVVVAIAPPVVTITSGAALTGSTVSVATISPTKVAVSGTAQAGAVAVVATVAPPVVTVGAVTVQAGAVPVPATIAPVKVTVSGTALTGSTAVVSTIAPSVVVLSGTSANTGSTVVVGAITPPVVVISGSPSQAVQASTITPPVVTISGTPSLPVLVTVGTISPGAVTVSGTPALAVLILPSTIAPPVVVIGPHSAAAGSTVTVATVAPVKVVVSGTAQAGAVVVVSTLAPVAVVIAAFAGAATIVPVSTIAPGVVTVSGTAQTGSTVSVATVSPVKVTVSGTAQTGSTVLAATVVGAVAIGAVTVTTITLVTPATIAPSVVVIGAVTVTTTTVVTVATITPPIAAISGTPSLPRTVTVSTVAPPVVTVGSISLFAAVLITPATIAGGISIPLPTMRAGAVALVQTIIGLVAMVTPTFTSGYVTPGTDARASGDSLRAGVTGDSIRAGVI